MKLENVSKSFWKDNKKLEIFKNLNVTFEKGKFYIILGSSGSGKSTLINMLGLLDTIDSGKYTIENEEVDTTSNLAKIRLEHIGFIFQSHYLNPRLNVFDNVYIASLINPNISKNLRKKRVNEMLNLVDLFNRDNHMPSEISGGEASRVCIARALINEPTFILADEPTGSLDYKNAQNIMKIFRKLVDNGKCVILVTHDLNNLKYGDIIYEIKNKKLVEVRKNDILKKCNK